MKKKFKFFKSRRAEIFLSTLCLIMGLYLAYLRLFLVIPPLKAQCTDIVNPRFDNGLLTTPATPNPVNKFGGTDSTGAGPGPCVVDKNAAILANFQLPSYAELHRDFFEKVSISFTSTYNINKITNPFGACAVPGTPATNSNLRFNARDQIIDLTCDLNLNGNPHPSSNHSAVVFINGSMYVTNDSLYPGTDRGVIYVVRDDVYIGKNVAQIDGIIISGGTIHTSCVTGTFICGPDSTSTTKQLVINGNLVSLNSATPISFDRDLAFINGNATPAEKVVADPKYLALFRQIFAQTMSVQTEDTNFASR